MILDKSKQRKMGVALGYTNFIVKMATQLVYVPIMLSFLGQNEYGVYQLVASIISYLSLLNFGFGGSYIRFYAQCRDDSEKEKKLNGTFLSIFMLFAILVFVVGIIIKQALISHVIPLRRKPQNSFEYLKTILKNKMGDN